MSDILVRGLDNKTVDRLKARAKRSGRSLQREAKLILEREAASATVEEALEAAARWRKQLAGHEFADSKELIRRDREG